jgi:alcohol dehydrogenase (cytochrome c)
MIRPALLTFFLGVFFLVLTGTSASAQTPSGQQLFQARCASCHGDDGRGGGRGFSLVAPAQPRAANAQAVREIILRGISAAGMPAFTMPDAELDAITAYVMSLRPATAAAPAGGRRGAGPAGPPPVFPVAPIAFTDVAKPKAGEWPSYNGDIGGNRFSPLNQINTSNVQRLAPGWMYVVRGAPRDLQMTPVVANGVMYVTSVNEVIALDAKTGRQQWRYARPRTQGLAGDAASGINRGVAILGDLLFTVTDNAHIIALRRDSGQLVWDTTIADSKQNYGTTSAPLVVNDLVITGVSGGDEGVRGFLDAYRATTGERVWRLWTVPAPGEPGSETWVGRAIEHGCAATWLTGTYDPDSGLLYWPTGNPCPDYNGDERKGDNLYSASVLAIDPKTGVMKWHFQFTPHDLWDWDATETPVLVDATFRGERRKLLLHGNRNGYFYVLDRLTGKMLLAEPFVKNLNWATGIDANGRPIRNPDIEPTPEGRKVCPAQTGATNWPSTAFNPSTGLFYLFAEESCAIYTKNDRWWEAGQSFYGGGTRRAVDATTAPKSLRALDLQTGKIAWELPNVGGGIIGSGLMATAGGLIFYGDGSSQFVATDAKTGKVLWQFNTSQNFKGGPMTYMIDGVQYIGVAAGSTILSFRLH